MCAPRITASLQPVQLGFTKYGEPGSPEAVIESRGSAVEGGERIVGDPEIEKAVVPVNPECDSGSRRRESNARKPHYECGAVPLCNVGDESGQVIPGRQVDVKFCGRKLSPAQVIAIREKRAGGARSSDIANEYGLDQTTVSLICLGKTYREVGGPITRRRLYGGTLTERLRIFQVIPSDPDACYGWSGRLTDDGYPAFNFDGESGGAHRFSLENKLGRKLLPDEVARHTCNNPPCTNERHLIPGSVADNNRDTVLAGRQARGEKNGSAKLTAQDVLDIRERASLGTVNYSDLARRHRVNLNCIKKVILGKSWRHLLPEERTAAPIPGAAL